MLIPENAIEEIRNRWDDGSKQSAFYKVGGEFVAYRWWSEDGLLTMEKGLNKDGLPHGEYRTWHDNGVIHSETFYVDGKEHGTAKQYDSDGKLIGTYKMDHGTGVDLWYLTLGVLSEERHYSDGAMEGFER